VRLLLFLVVAAHLAQAEESALTITLSTSSLHLDERLILSLEAKVPEEYQWDQESLHRGLDLVEGDAGTFSVACEEFGYADGVLKAVFTLDPWKVGDAIICFLPVRLVAPDKAPLELYSTARQIRVEPLPAMDCKADLAGIFPLRGQPALALSSDNRQQLHHPNQIESSAHAASRASNRRWLLGALLGSALLGASGYFGRRIRWRAPELARPDPRQVAEDALAVLASKDLPQQELFEAFYVELTAIVRQFIEEYHRIRAPEQTTEEFLHEAAAHPAFKPDVRSLLREFLWSADLVKFARHSPSLDQCAEAFKAARGFIASI
jgi:hypothetical protein